MNGSRKKKGSLFLTAQSNNSLDAMQSQDPPIMSEGYLASVSIECLFGITNFILKIAETVDQQTAKSLTECCWPSLLASFSLFFDRSLDEKLLIDVLKHYTLLIKICGLCSLFTPAEAFLTSLGKAAVPFAFSNTESQTEPTFSFKSLLATKALFNVAETLAPLLDEGAWYIIFDIFQRLEKTNSAGSGRIGSELFSFANSLEQLTNHTQTMELNSLRRLLRALRKLSTESINKGRGLFFTSKINELAVLNLARIGELWPIYSQHIVELSSNKDLSVRTLVVDSFTALLSTTLSLKKTETTAGASKIPKGMQNDFLEVLESFSRSSHQATREKSLQALYNILQVAGQEITTGWPFVLSIVMNVATSNDSPLIPIAFKSVQLIAADFLSLLSNDCLSLYISSVGCFVLQTTDVNISLTSINILWNISDFLERESQRFDADQPLEKSVDAVVDLILRSAVQEATQRALGTFVPSVQPFLVLKPSEKLWLDLFTELKQASIDKRPEVRNCAAQTLFKTITMHGSMFTLPVWSSIVWDVMFPLLEAVYATSASVGDEDPNSHEQKSFKMLVHYSRNTASKQWNETQVLALNGVVRVFKSFFTRLKALNSFHAAWAKLLADAEIFFVTPSVEVSSVECSPLVFCFLLTHATRAGHCFESAGLVGVLLRFRRVREKHVAVLLAVRPPNGPEPA
jgi:hypothetical protein